MTRLDIEAERALHVGDVHDLDVVGARAAGVAAVLVDRDSDVVETNGCVKSLETVAEIARRGLRGRA